jgi:hypothetical protein
MVETTQKARLQLQDQDQEGLLRRQGVRDGYVSFGMRGGPISTAAADGSEQHAAAPDTPPRPLCFLVRRRRHPEKSWVSVGMMGVLETACISR